MKKFKVPFRGKYLAATSAGKEGNDGIIFIHGNSMSSKIWRKQFEGAALERYRLIAFDLPGHGDSDNLESYGLPVLAESLTKVLKHFSPKRFVMVGNSLGGNLALQASTVASGCKGIMLVDSPVLGKPPALENALIPNPYIGMLFAREIDRANLDKIPGIVFHNLKDTPDFVIPDYVRADGLNRQMVMESVNTSDYNDENEILKAHPYPVAIVSGKEEKLINNAYFDTLDVANLWGGKTILIENAAHCPQWENAEAFNGLLHEFCSDTLKP